MTDASDRLYERVVVLRCQAGDDAAFEELVGRYSQRLRYYLRKMLREADRAEDVLQDVWLQVPPGAAQAG
jgi:RNA polymerase sigma-70 factor, ECF subfamily